MSERGQNRRKKICQINIKVNLIVWLVEFSGCMTLAVDFLLVGSRNNTVTGILGNLTTICYFILLPCTFLINCSAGVNGIVENSWFGTISQNFNPTKGKQTTQKPSDRQERNQRTTRTAKSESIPTISQTVHEEHVPNKTLKNETKEVQTGGDRPLTIPKIKEAWK